MKKKLIVMAVALLAMTACAVKPTMTVENQTGKELIGMDYSEATDNAEWKDANLFGNTKVKNGASIEIERKAFPKSGTYDLAFGDAEGELYFIWDVDIGLTNVVTVTENDKDKDK